LATNPAVAVERLSKYFPHIELSRLLRGSAFHGSWALREVDLELWPGEALCIMGPNGSGKTTLLKLIATLLLPTEGRIFVQGLDAMRRPLAAKRHLGFITANEESFYGRLTGRQNLAFFARLHNLEPKAAIDPVAQLLQLEPYLDRHFFACSTGIRRRFDIARGLLHHPDILLLDEPTTNLDPCGLVFRNPRRREHSLGQDFAEEWTESRSAFFLTDYRAKNLATIARWVLDRHPAPGSVLDIGSSYGTLLEMFPESWRRVGIEPSGRACQVARERLPGAQIINSLLGDVTLPEASFEVICLVDTAYYLAYPLRDLRRVRRLLKPGGMLIIEAQNFANRGYVYRWLKHPFSDTWMYFYTPATLEKILVEAGMEVKASFSLPGHQVGAKERWARFLTWTEYYLTEAIAKVSAGRVNLTPHFVLVATRGADEPRGTTALR
jgi:ABC-type Na+ transport system ATPase subunit NatA/SAM-dependent methyltransferase